ncbi:MAG: hypothetical protein JXJ04_22235, partial [Spirochaetales bacterium]|nr:hypothetical protein [Spirochaetales bacterium]
FYSLPVIIQVEEHPQLKIKFISLYTIVINSATPSSSRSTHFQERWFRVFSYLNHRGYEYIVLKK